MPSLTVVQFTFEQFLNQVFENCRDHFLAYFKQALEQALVYYRDKEIIRTPRYSRGNVRKRWGFRIRKYVDSPLGPLQGVKIPRVRGRGREIRLFADSYVKRMGQLSQAMLWLFVQGLSTRKVSKFMEQMYGFPISANAVSGLQRRVEEQLSQLRSGALPPGICALVVDGVWGRFRGQGRSCLLVAIGVDKEGKSHILDWQGCDSEGVQHWVRLFRRLRQRGLSRVELLVSDDQKGARLAFEWVWGRGADYQLCLWHFHSQLQARLQGLSWWQRQRFGAEYWDVFNALDEAECARRAEAFLERWQAFPEMVKYFKAHWPQLTNYYRFPTPWRHKLRTVNLAEQFFSQLQTFISRFPGWIDEQHLERTMALFLQARKGFFNPTKQGVPHYLINFNTFT